MNVAINGAGFGQYAVAPVYRKHGAAVDKLIASQDVDLVSVHSPPVMRCRATSGSAATAPKRARWHAAGEHHHGPTGGLALPDVRAQNQILSAHAPTLYVHDGKTPPEGLLSLHMKRVEAPAAIHIAWEDAA